MTRERPAVRRGGLRWDERALLPGHAGVRPWLAVLLALAFTAAGALADIQRIDRLGIVFQACYFVGCLLAITVVARKDLFGPMVAPPLILAFAVPSVVLVVGSVPTGGGVAAALAVGTPLINGFPTMAITTGFTLAIGIFRICTQRPPGASESLPQSNSDLDIGDPGMTAPDIDNAEPRRPEPARPNSLGAPPRRVRTRVREADSEPLTEPILRVTKEAFSRFKSESFRRRQL